MTIEFIIQTRTFWNLKQSSSINATPDRMPKPQAWAGTVLGQPGRVVTLGLRQTEQGAGRQ